ncbi:IS256-like element ISSde5 family transposase [Shewanella sp. ULN5]|uniref:IS256-like element ISSde5 family transposase n=1 Tax=Shewanella sp. ULN5 TaxID=2994678 RepID=UPI00273DC72E|nr:IS256-like element ISSde5 family transposase [Shewanella sp. ULN5]MDP5145011.1 IS256-like element ISSde5 family transposase [Shewanella sp. ULN5]
MTQPFNFEQALKDLQAGKNLTGKDSILGPLIKQLTEAALQAELEQHLAHDEQPNRKNGKTAKTIKHPSGNFELETPRDRNGSFEPQLIKKNQTTLTDEIDRKVLSMFSMGMSYRDINQHVEEMYGINVSSATINAITDKLIPELKAWQQRPLDSHYPIVWLDAIHYKVKEDGRYISKAVYTLLALNMQGKKEILGLHLSENEGANYWLSVLTDLNNRGVKDILIACVDGLTGFPEAIASIFPNTETQLCIIHQIRNSMKYVASKNQKAFMADLKCIYRAVSKEAAELALDELEAKWGEAYPLVINSWRRKWHNLSHYFKYPEHIRKVIYTTNAVEAVHRQFRKLTKTKGAFPNENSLLKLLYAGILNASNKWTMPIHNWSLCLSQLAIYFEGRLDSVLEI